MKMLTILALGLLSFSIMADIQINGLVIQDARTSPRETLESARIKKGDFEGNGGDGLRLRYGMMYNHLYKLNPSNVEGVLPPSAILNYDAQTIPLKILLTNNAVYVPSIFYISRKDIKNVVHSLFSVQLISYGRFNTSGDAEGVFNDPLLWLDHSLVTGGVLDFENRLNQVFFEVAQFIDHGSLKKDNRVIDLRFLDFQLVDEDLFDRFGTRVCGVHAKKYLIKLNVYCWGHMSHMEQRLLMAHEIFRALGIDDDDYPFTYQFMMFNPKNEMLQF